MALGHEHEPRAGSGQQGRKLTGAVELSQFDFSLYVRSAHRVALRVMNKPD